jgi:hypothetical protein
MRLAQDLQDMPPELRQFIQGENAAVRQRHLARHGDVPPTAQPDIGDGMMRGATRPARDHRRPAAREPGNAVDARGLKGLGRGHGWQDGREPLRQHRRARPWRIKEEQMMVRTPA